MWAGLGACIRPRSKSGDALLMANNAPDSFRPRAATGLALGALIGLVAHELELLSLLSVWGDRALMVVGAAILGAAISCTHCRGSVAPPPPLSAATPIFRDVTPPP